MIQACLPELVKTHEAGWSHRIGGGATWRDALLLVAASPEGTLVGAAAAAPALLREELLAIPWWMLDVVAVHRSHRSHGVGRRLVDAVLDIAEAAGATALYGLCPPHVVGWYEMMGLSATSPGAILESDVKINGDDLTLEAEADECWFFTDVGPTGPRLYLPA